VSPLAFCLGVDPGLYAPFVREIDAEQGSLFVRGFPDGETFIRIDTLCAEREVVLVCGLHQPDAKILPLLFAADTLRDLGAAAVGLVVPYLPYMRQDTRFEAGEGITARYFAALLSNHFDWLVTVDPHLHRFRNLNEIYRIPTRVVHAAPVIAAWIKEQVSHPLLIGPDGESEQWVADIAQRTGAPHLTLRKLRTGDREVSVSLPELGGFGGCTPVLIDDIVSTGHTLVETIRHLVQLEQAASICVVVHGVFSAGALAEIREAGAERIVTCNTIPHESNAIDVSVLLAGATRSLLQRKPGDQALHCT
jgi:ribose-phosphate pyrophosphokinase